MAIRERKALKVLIVLRDFQKELTQSRSVGLFHFTESRILIRSNDNHSRLTSSSDALRFAGKRGIDQRTEFVLRVL